MATGDVVRGGRGATIGHDRNIEFCVLIERDLSEVTGRTELRGRERPVVRLGRGGGNISLTVFSGRLLAMMWMSGAPPASAIGVKSVNGS